MPAHSKYLSTIILLLFFAPCKSQHKDKADSLFATANERLKTKWEHLDSTDFAHALSEYTEVANLRPEFWQAYRNKARVHIYLKQYIDALEDLTLAITYADKNSHPGLFEMRGIVFYHLGIYLESINDLTVTINNSKVNDNALYWRSQSRWKLEQKKEACKDLYEAVQKNKEHAKKNKLVRCD